MSKTVLVIDGENFRHKIEQVLKNESLATGIADTIIDFNRLFSVALKGLKISKKIFYGAKIRFNPTSSKKSLELIKAQRKLINSLKSQEFEFVLAGNVRSQTVEKRVVFKEKGVDVRMAVDLVTWACDEVVDTVILCSSDSDLQPAVKELRKRGVEVIYLGFEIQPNKGLTYTTSRTILLRNSEIIDACRGENVT